jgi:ABC-type multidrug transport system ATPase subunit
LTLPAVSPVGIRFENIEKRYGGLYALRRVSLEIAAGECVVLAGRNGSGKTTLLRIAAQLVRPSSGTLTFLTNMQRANTELFANGIGVPCHDGLRRTDRQENFLLLRNC